MYWCMELPISSSLRECLQSRVDYLRKIFTINEKKSKSKPVDSVRFLGYSISEEDKTPNPEHFEKKCKSTN